MTRRALLQLGMAGSVCGVLLAAGTAPKPDARPATVALRGALVQVDGKPPAIRLKDGKVVQLAGDAQTVAVLKDKRLADTDFEVDGHYRADGVFQVNPRYTDAIWVHANGERLMITYWCDTCSIRTYAPGKCMCCQQETRLDLRKPNSQ